MHGMRDGKLPNMSLVPKPKQEKNPDGTSAVDEDEYKLQVLGWKDNAKIQIERKRDVNEVNHKIYAPLINQLLLAMHTKIEVTIGHEQVKSYQYGIALLTITKKIMCGVEKSLQKTMATVTADKMLHALWQNTNVAKNNYKSQFSAYGTILGAYSSSITAPPALMNGNLRELYPSLSDPKSALSHYHEAATEAAKDQYLTCILLVGEKMQIFGI